MASGKFADFPDVELPADGQRIRYRMKYSNGQPREGIVDFCWLGIEPVINLVGGGHIHPTCGDTWEAI
jgi:hypothetical protein